MKNKLFLGAILASLVIAPLLSSAQGYGASTDVNVSASTNTQNTNIESEARIKAREELEMRRKELEQKRENFKTEMESRRENFKGEMEANKEQREQNRETIKDQIEERKENIKSEVEERRTKAVDVIKERIGSFTQNVIKRFNAAIERLETLASRIDSRIKKIEEEGGNTIKAKELMVIARTQIETAKLSVSGIEVEVDKISSTEATTTAAIKGDFDSLKNQIEKAKKDIKNAHASLVEVIKSLKPGQLKATTTATTTVSTSTTSSN